jgi:hypothetical protein
VRLFVMVGVLLSLVLAAQAGPPAVPSGVPVAETPQVLLPPVPRCALEMGVQGRLVCRWNNLEVESLQNRVFSNMGASIYNYSLTIKTKDRELSLHQFPIGCSKGQCLQPLAAISDCATMAAAAQQGNLYLSVYVVFDQPVDPYNHQAKDMIHELMNTNRATVFPENPNVREVGCMLNRSSNVVAAPLDQPPQNEAGSFPPPVPVQTDAPSRWVPGGPSGYSPSPDVIKYCEGLKKGCLAKAGSELGPQQDCHSDYQACISESNCDVQRDVCLNLQKTKVWGQ